MTGLDQIIGSQSPDNLHVLVIAGSGVLVVGGYIDLMARGNGNVFISNGVTCADLGTFLSHTSALSSHFLNEVGFSYCIKGNGQRPTWHLALGFSGMVDDGLVVLICSMGEIHAYDVETSLT